MRGVLTQAVKAVRVRMGSVNAASKKFTSVIYGPTYGVGSRVFEVGVSCLAYAVTGAGGARLFSSSAISNSAHSDYFLASMTSRCEMG